MSGRQLDLEDLMDTLRDVVNRAEARAREEAFTAAALTCEERAVRAAASAAAEAAEEARCCAAAIRNLQEIPF